MFRHAANGQSAGPVWEENGYCGLGTGSFVHTVRAEVGMPVKMFGWEHLPSVLGQQARRASMLSLPSGHMLESDERESRVTL